MSVVPPSINLESCSSDELASFIYHRFDNNLSKAKEYISKTTTKLVGLARLQESIDDVCTEKGEKFEAVSCLVPRGKHTFYICKDNRSITLKGKNSDVKLQRKIEERTDSFVAVMLDKKYLVISSTTDTPIQCKKSKNKVQELNNVCFEIKTEYFEKVISVLGIDEVHEATSTSGINCYYKSNMGKLNLVEQVGLVFSRPPMLVQKESIEKIEWANGSARFINLAVNDFIEFASINREFAKEIKSFLMKLCVNRKEGDHTNSDSCDNARISQPKDNGSISVRSRRSAARVAREATRIELQDVEGDGHDSESSFEYQVTKTESDDDEDDENTSNSTSVSDDETSSDKSTVSAADEDDDVKPPAKKKVKSHNIENIASTKNSSSKLQQTTSKKCCLMSFFAKKS